MPCISVAPRCNTSHTAAHTALQELQLQAETEAGPTLCQPRQPRQPSWADLSSSFWISPAGRQHSSLAAWGSQLWLHVTVCLYWGSSAAAGEGSWTPEANIQRGRQCWTETCRDAMPVLEEWHVCGRAKSWRHKRLQVQLHCLGRTHNLAT